MAGKPRMPRLDRGAFGVRWVGCGSRRTHGFVKYEASKYCLPVKSDLRALRRGRPGHRFHSRRCVECRAHSHFSRGTSPPRSLIQRKTQSEAFPTRATAPPFVHSQESQPGKTTARATDRFTLLRPWLRYGEAHIFRSYESGVPPCGRPARTPKSPAPLATAFYALTPVVASSGRSHETQVPIRSLRLRVFV